MRMSLLAKEHLYTTSHHIARGHMQAALKMSLTLFRLDAWAHPRVLQSGQGMNQDGQLPHSHGSTSLEQDDNALHLH